MSGKQEFSLGFGLTGDQPLFAENAATCECGLAVIPGVGLIPPSFEVTSAEVIIKNVITGEKRMPDPLPDGPGLETFDFVPDATLDSILAGEAPSLNDPNSWLGLSTDPGAGTPGTVTVDPTKLNLRNNEVVKLTFLLEVDRDDVGFLHSSQFQIAARSPGSASHPDFSFSGITSPLDVPSAPEPSSIVSILSLGVLGLGAMRKKTNRTMM